MTGAALGTAAERVARAIEVRSMAAVEWRVSERAKGTEKDSLRGTCGCQWVVVMTVVMVQGDGRACSGRLGKKPKVIRLVTQTTPGTARQ